MSLQCWSCTSWWPEGKVWHWMVGGINALFPAFPFSPWPVPTFPPTFSLVLSCIGHKAKWLRCHCCYAWYSSKSGPWEHGTLRNIGKYSFRLTPFLPLSNSAKPTTATTPLQPLIQKRSSDWTVSKLTPHVTLRGQSRHLPGAGGVKQREFSWFLLPH